MTEAHGPRVIVLGHGHGHGLLASINCGAHHGLMRSTVEITAGRLDGTQSQGGVAEITIESLRALSLFLLALFSSMDGNTGTRLNLARLAVRVQ